MVARKILDENPLDLIVPKAGAAAKRVRAAKKVVTKKARPKRKKAKMSAAQTEKKSRPGAKKSVQKAKTTAPKSTRTPRQPAAPAIPAKAEKTAQPPNTPERSGKTAGKQASPDPKRRVADKERTATDRRRITATPGQYLTFFMGGEEYGAGILKVKEIIEFDSLTKVPMTPPWIRGVLNLRGNVVAVVDLAVKFGLPPSEISDRTCVVIVEIDMEVEKAVMGVIVDAVSQVMDFSADEIEPPPAFGTRVHVDYLQGMGKIDEKFVLLIDTDRILAAEELMEVSALEGETGERQETSPGVSQAAVEEPSEASESSPS